MSKVYDGVVQKSIKQLAGVEEHTSSYDPLADKVFLKYANTTSPLGIRKATRSTLAPFTGTWDKAAAIHLLNRTMFGAKPSDVATALGGTMTATVNALLNNTPNPWVAPINWYENAYADPTNVAMGSTWVNADYGDGTVNYYRTIGMQGQWLKNICTQNFSLHEKMVLFLYNLVPVQFGSVGDARFLYQYMQLLHQYAMGNYKDFLRSMTKNGAMLYYLNGYINNKYSPDENYARELQELFSVGKDGGQQYSEDDVRRAAKVLTGWRVDDVTRTTFFDPNFHDTSNKAFSSFYNNNIIAGVTGATGGAVELDALLDMLFTGTAATTTAKYICRKLYRFFVYYDIDATTEANIIAPLAATFVSNNFNLKPVIEQLFKSEHFFDMQSRGCYIKTPVDIIAGVTRVMSVPIDPATTMEDEHWLYVRMYYNMESCGMGPGEVPNVSGFMSYYQSPQWHELFINSNTLPRRMKWKDNLLTQYGHYVNGSTSYKADVIGFIQTLSNPADPDAIINDVVDYCYGVPVSASKKSYFKQVLMSGQTNNIYWTTAWNNYLANPTDPAALGVVNTRLRALFTEMFRMPEHHLC